ncbi:MAG TPA: P-II family nitrogen regulator [Candidatus Hypogeohydataceae bacterium YC41]
MKKVVAVVRLERFGEVRESLEKEGFQGMTVTPTSGAGAEKGVTLCFRGRHFQEPFVPRVKLEIVAPDMDIPKIAEVICDAAKTGRIGDGRIFVEPVEEVIRIRDGKRGEDVIAPGRLGEIPRKVGVEVEALEYEIA